VLDQIRRRKCNWLEHTLRRKWWQRHQTSTTVDTTRPQRKTATKEYLEKRSWERNVDSRIQVQLEEDRGSSTRQSWMETSGLWTMFHREWQGISQVSETDSKSRVSCVTDGAVCSLRLKVEFDLTVMLPITSIKPWVTKSIHDIMLWRMYMYDYETVFIVLILIATKCLKSIHEQWYHIKYYLFADIPDVERHSSHQLTVQTNQHKIF